MPSNRTESEVAHAIVNSAAGGNLAVVAAVPGQRVKIYRMLVQANGGAVTVQDTTGLALSAPYTLAAASPPLNIADASNLDPLFITALGVGIQLNVSAAVQCSADIWYLQGP